ncbi:MAG: flagellar biosynthesis regulator FlhF [Sulfuricurvum sp. PC08-66]|nr:MAG: flagellar biosynthesis regulator FlhF [Sulfuricurvum sp. PC08-66]
MKFLTFTGKSPAEALKRVKTELGDDVTIIETKEVRKKTLNQTALYEVVVAFEEDHIRPIKLKRPPAQAYEMTPQKMAQSSEDVLLSISQAAKQISDISSIGNLPKTPYSEDRLTLKTPEAPKESPHLKEIQSEIAKLSDKIKLIQNMFWEEKSPSNIPIPPEFAEIYKLALDSGMNRDHLEKIMHLTLEHMPNKMRENSVTVKRYFQTLLRKMVPVRHEMPLKPNTKRVIMLVGPTGVGKTTSIAKLAARFSFMMDKKYKVGLIALDSYRIGAVEQLMQYARMMKLGIETVIQPAEFSAALNALRYCDYILIDTMGSSPYDQEKIGAIYGYLDSNETQMEVETILVLPSHLKYEDMLATYERFSYLGVDTLMFTKLDETKGFGTIFSLLNEIDTPVSYLSIGQEVPEDLVQASSDYLVDCLLHGFSKVKP